MRTDECRCRGLGRDVDNVDVDEEEDEVGLGDEIRSTMILSMTLKMKGER